MKKLVSTLAILLLFISAIGVTFNFTSKVYAETWHLDVFTSPAEVNTYIPGGIVGTGDYPVGWSGPVTAPTPVNKGVNDTQWRFDHWEENGTNRGSANPTTFPILVPAAGDYINVTAVYKTCYWLEIDTPFSSPAPGTEGWWWAGQIAHAGLNAGSQWIMYGVWWYFEYWTGDASGSNFASSDGILMDGPKTAQAMWYVQYYLEWHSYEWNDGIYVGPGTYSGANWYNGSLTIPLSAPQIGHSGANWRYLFDHWDKDGVFYSTDQNINVHMDAPHNMSAHYIGQDYITFNDNIGGISCVSTLSGWYNWSTTYTFKSPATAPIPAGAGTQFRWAWWDENAVLFSSNETIQYHVTAPATLTARYQTQYYVKLDTTAPPGLPAKVVIKGSDIIGTPPIGGWFDAGTTVNFLVPDVAELVSGDHMWQFDTDAGKQWWLNGLYWGLGAMWNATWRQTGGALLNQPMNVTANYKKFFWLEWNTDPAGLGWQGNAWLPEGLTFWTGPPPGSFPPCWVFKQLFEDGASKGIGIMSYLCTMDKAHTIIAEYVNKTTLYITSPPPFTAPKACTNFDVFVYAANFDAERGRDLFAVDFHIYYNTTLIKLVAVDYNSTLNALWGENNWFVAKNETFVYSGWDYYWFVATALKGATGFTGTKPIVKLTFHIELDPCYPTVYTTPIDFSTYFPIKLTNSTGNIITPELTYGATYTISAPQPIVQIDLDKTPIRRNVPQEYFDAFVNIKLGIKVTDFYIVIYYPRDLIDPVNVTFGDYLPGPAFTKRGFTFSKSFNSTHGRIVVECAQDPSSPHAYGNGTLFVIEFKVIKATFWQNPDLTGGITINKLVSYLSVCCPYPKYQYFNPDVIVYDAVYKYVPLPGDLNFDGMVNVVDLRLLAGKYGLSVGIGDPYDVNRDGIVDIVDLVLVALHFGDHI